LRLKITIKSLFVIAVIASSAVVIPLVILILQGRSGGLLTHLGPIATFQDTQTDIYHSISYLSGDHVIDGANISSGFYIPHELINNTGTEEWNRIALFNDATITLASTDSKIYIYAYDSSSVNISGVHFTHELSISLFDSASLTISNCNWTGPSDGCKCNCYDSSSGVIVQSLLGSDSSIMCVDESRLNLTDSNVESLHAIDKSMAMVAQCWITNILVTGIHLSSGSLTITASTFVGDYTNNSIISNCTIAQTIPSVVAFDSSTVELQGDPSLLLVYLHDAASFSAEHVCAEQVSISVWNHAHLMINNCSLNYIELYQYGIGLVYNSTISFAYAWMFSDLTLSHSTVTHIHYERCYTDIDITINNGILPPGYSNTCLLIDTTYSDLTQEGIHFSGTATATIQGSTPAWTLNVVDEATLDFKSVTASGLLYAFYYENSRGEVSNSTLFYIGIVCYSKLSHIIENSTINYIDVLGLQRTLLAVNSTFNYATLIHGYMDYNDLFE
jgi:hypothetical protein